MTDHLALTDHEPVRISRELEIERPTPPEADPVEI